MLVDSIAGFGFSTRLSALGCALVLSGLGTRLARVHASPAAGHAMAGRDLPAAVPAAGRGAGQLCCPPRGLDCLHGGLRSYAVQAAGAQQGALSPTAGVLLELPKCTEKAWLGRCPPGCASGF